MSRETLIKEILDYRKGIRTGVVNTSNLANQHRVSSTVVQELLTVAGFDKLNHNSWNYSVSPVQVSETQEELVDLRKRITKLEQEFANLVNRYNGIE